MTTDSATLTPDNDALLAGVLDELLAGSRGGRMPDLEGVIRRHPQLEGEIRELWATMMIAEDFASFSGDLDALTNPGGDSPSGALQDLPRAFGGYELLEELGRGGMGIVYRARQKSPGRIVALKRPRRRCCIRISCRCMKSANATAGRTSA
jgi:eukaryotic-like serine/threonine-protein kinase